MPAISATAPGKIILFGEHAVVYGYPAIAVPVTQVAAKAVVTANPHGQPGSVQLNAPDIHLETELSALPPEHPLSAAVTLVLKALHVNRSPACTIRVTSTIPIAAGLGSGAAVSIAILRAYSTFLGHPLPDAQVSTLAFEIEKLHHGTPSGIDNTTITYARPVYYQRHPEEKGGATIANFNARLPFTIVIGDTGVSSPTSKAVGEVRLAWQAAPEHYENLFRAIGKIVQAARQAIESGQVGALGPLMNENHALLQQIGVSSPELDHLVTAALQAGSTGAKLSGGGQGGNMIALVAPEKAEAVSQALRTAGATRTILTQVK